MSDRETPARWVMCNDCGTWKQLQKGNHHPYCGCGSDNFRWEDERDHHPEAAAASAPQAPSECLIAQIDGLLIGHGALEDHRAVVAFLESTGLPAAMVKRVHMAIVGAERKDHP